jgi:hypothetical protein
MGQKSNGYDGSNSQMNMMGQIVRWLWCVKQSNYYDGSNSQMIMMGQIVSFDYLTRS